MRLSAIVLCFAMLGTSMPLRAEPTKVMVRAISADAKFIGTSMGGMAVTVRNARTGAVLAQGITAGGTGPTPAIMEASGRSPRRSDGDTAGFAAVLDIDEPTLVEVILEGPVAHPQSSARVTATRWIMPGEDVTRVDGWVLEVPGLVIEPAAEISGRTVRLRPTVQLLCGCPITSDGLWKAQDYDVRASLWQDSTKVSETRLVFAQSPGGFSGEIKAPRLGAYRLVVAASNAVTSNSGIASMMVSVNDTP